MNKHFSIIYIMVLFIMSSCPTPFLGYIRNYSDQKVKITNIYRFKDDALYYKTIRSYNNILEEININNDNLKLFDNIIVAQTHSNNINSYIIPEKTTVFLGPTISKIDKMIIDQYNQSDTIIFFGKEKNYKDYIKNGSLRIIKGFINKRICIKDINSY